MFLSGALLTFNWFQSHQTQKCVFCGAAFINAASGLCDGSFSCMMWDKYEAFILITASDAPLEQILLYCGSSSKVHRLHSLHVHVVSWELAAAAEEASERRDGERDKLLQEVNSQFFCFVSPEHAHRHTHTHTHTDTHTHTQILQMQPCSLERGGSPDDCSIRGRTCQEKAVVMETGQICSNCGPTRFSAGARSGLWCDSVHVCVCWSVQKC